MRCKGRVALVTGAGRGIGREIGLALAAEGAAVGLVARSAAEVEAVADEIRKAGGRALAVSADLAQDAGVETAVQAVSRELGPIDVLVNNAGNNLLGRMVNQPVDEWWSMMTVNVRAPYLLSRAVLPGMIERKWGRIVNIASVASKVGMIFCTGYCTAKHAIIGFTRSLAVEVAAQGVTVNAVCPGFVDTALTESTMKQRTELFGAPLEVLHKVIVDKIPQKKFIDARDIADAVLFFASDASSRITGEALNVSGGQVMH